MWLDREGTEIRVGVLLLDLDAVFVCLEQFRWTCVIVLCGPSPMLPPTSVVSSHIISLLLVFLICSRLVYASCCCLRMVRFRSVVATQTHKDTQ